MIDSLKHPFDSAKILRKKRAIKRTLLANGEGHRIKVAILGGSTTNDVKDVLELFLLKAGFSPSFYQSEYNKYYEDALFKNKDLEEFAPDIIYLHTSVVNLLRFPELTDTEEEINDLLQSELVKFKSIWEALEQYNCLVIQNNFDLPIHRSLGNLDATDIHGMTHFIQSLNMEFAAMVRERKYLILNDINYLSASIGLTNWFDKQLWHTAKYAMSFDAIVHLANNIANLIKAALGKTKKCLVLDLDNTCWGGVIGDDGLNGIKLGNESASGEAFVAFQQYAKELNEKGILLAVCSKNEFENAKEGFTHSDSRLKFEDFSVFKANWDPKFKNIQEIATELNIGLDSLVFVDDNPAEREIVLSQLPMVSVPNVGDNVLDYIDHIEQNGYFELTSLSKDDLARKRLYTENASRAREESKFKTYDEFLASLDMSAEIKNFDSTHLERITQLINKTNQFNLTTKRYTIAQVEEMAADQDTLAIYGRLSDKFGDNGLISVVIGKIEGDSCHIDTWLMSCRVLKRQMENAMLRELVSLCKERGVANLYGYYTKTAKNNMVSKLFGELGFAEIPCDQDVDGKWKLNLEHYQEENINITIN